MRKRGLALLSAVLLIVLLCPAGLKAEGDTVFTAVSSYYMEGTLYSFVQAEGQADVGQWEAELIINKLNMGESHAMDSQVADSEGEVSYLLLVDGSTSMRSYGAWIRDFADSLLRAEKREAKFAVAVFGDHYEVIAEGLKESKELKAALKELDYGQSATDICGGLTDALDYLSGQARQAGELVNLILLTDGVPYSKADSDGGGVSPQDLERLLADTPEVVVHTLGFKEWDPLVLDAVSSGSGIDRMARSEREASKAGVEIAGFVDALYSLDFSMAWDNQAERVEAALGMSQGSAPATQFISLGNVGNVGLLSSEVPSGSGSVPLLPGQGESGGEGDVPGSGETPEIIPPLPGQGEGQDTGNVPGSGEGEESEEDAGSGEGEESEEDVGSGEGEESGEDVESGEGEESGAGTESGEGQEEGLFGIKPYVVALAGVGALALIVAIAVCLIRKSRSRSIRGVAIRMKLKVLSGTCRKDGKEILLGDELFIGSDKSCDLVFQDVGMAARNARIFFKDGIIYIENLSAMQNLSIGGMKIYQPNRLRSGDEIAMGNARFCLLF